MRQRSGLACRRMSGSVGFHRIGSFRSCAGHRMEQEHVSGGGLHNAVAPALHGVGIQVAGIFLGRGKHAAMQPGKISIAPFVSFVTSTHSMSETNSCGGMPRNRQYGQSAWRPYPWVPEDLRISRSLKRTVLLPESPPRSHATADLRSGPGNKGENSETGSYRSRTMSLS